MDVKIEGKNVQFLSDPMLNNCAGGGSPPNAATLVGVLQGPGLIAVLGDEPCPLCGKNHGDEGKLEEKTESQGVVTDVENAIKAALAAANADAKRLQAIEDGITAAREVMRTGDAAAKAEAQKTMSRLANSRVVNLAAMMGGVTCKCGSVKYAGTSFVQYKDVCKRLKHHSPKPYFSLTKPPRKGKRGSDTDKGYSPRRGAKFRMAVSVGHRAKFRSIWKERKANAEDSIKGLTEEVAYPPGQCAAQQLVVHAMDHKCRPLGLTERYFQSNERSPPLDHTKFRVRDMGADGVPGPPRPMTADEVKPGRPIPPCGTCQVILQALMCPDDKPTECAHAKAKVCSKC
jgi:hypothetical protein